MAPAILVLHEVFGVNADLRATCDELAAAGFVALCPDLFWRQEPHVDLPVRSQPDWEKGLALYKAFDVDAGVRDVEATVNAARALTGPGCRHAFSRHGGTHFNAEAARLSRARTLEFFSRQLA